MARKTASLGCIINAQMSQIYQKGVNQSIIRIVFQIARPKLETYYIYNVSVYQSNMSLNQWMFEAYKLSIK